MLCYTYLNFKKALDETGLQTVERSRSPLQPWLAYWGIFWSLMMGTYGLNFRISADDSVF
jgi:hypothetical protein